MSADMFFTREYSTSVLLVCTANICRSPMAEGMLNLELKERGLQRKIRVDSAGTHASQPGRPADPRSKRICAPLGIDLRKSKSRQVREQDFARFDYILAMDLRNREWLLENCPDGFRERISLLGEWAVETGLIEIPDPYYGNMAGFEMVIKLLQTSIQGFVQELAVDK
jgi:low molecular weight protein-tyrosine phosphatase